MRRIQLIVNLDRIKKISVHSTFVIRNAFVYAPCMQDAARRSEIYKIRLPAFADCLF